MKRILLRLGVAVLTFSLGVSLTAIYWLYRLPEVIELERPKPQRPEGPTRSSSFPGLSVKIKKPNFSSYFPGIALSENDWGNQFISDWYSGHLLAMGEWGLPSLVDEEESYRFLWLRSFHKSIAIRVCRTGSNQYIVVKRLNGRGGYKPRTLELTSVRRLSDDEWYEFMRYLEDSYYWKMPTQDDKILNDGARWILEAYREGRYHLVDRQCPEPGSYREACLYLLRTSGLLKDIPEHEIY
jgi:hypothetical protein